MAKPILSFISAVYNKADVLAETLACLRTQRGFSVNELEFVFVDDKSTDGSLEFLQKEAEQDSRVTVISDGKNMGPAIRFNQAAKAAKGNWVLALDADDILPVNAAQVMLNECLTNEAQLVFGKSKRSLDVVEIPYDANVQRPADPLAFAARKKIVRMGILAERTLWLEAGGADESVFIQDQSLPLRLSAKAEQIAYIEDYVYFLRPADDSNLSANVMQQHHDRFFSLLPFLKQDISAEARKAIVSQISSTIWKSHRDNGRALPQLSGAHWQYLLHKITGKENSDQELAATADQLRALPNIRRPD
ncbi:glycosyltransferase family 2 protein [Cohaesibacter gelatinilyticus]|uniref:Glycosyl transferase family 2 n=1 Tax=Cohaesibacter gelatinilyticus TaxID=372072 RepID=A0A285ND61_9HYPH|nr:glycosyltransferase family 2 protein [Cohaesibacter gelatinilyticus]SNZ06833.1 Glycosyl transferase family 2 [Cohaesibacter gelatinilyticus]